MSQSSQQRGGQSARARHRYRLQTFAAASMVAMSMEKPCAMASRSIFEVASRSSDWSEVTSEKQRSWSTCDTAHP